MTVSHSRSTTIDDVRIELDTAPGERPKPDVYLRTPEARPYPEVHYHTDVETGAAVLDVPDTGGQGNGTMTFQFLVAPLSEERVEVVGETSVTQTGRRFVGRPDDLSDRTEFELRSESG